MSSASAWVTRSGWAMFIPSTTRRPRRVRSSGPMAGSSARAMARAGLRGSSPSASSGRDQKPAAHSEVTDRARPRRASSSAIQAPSELPARCAVAIPRASR